MGGSQWELMRDVIPNDHSRQVQSTYYVEQAMTAEEPPKLVMDLGCGGGRSRALFQGYDEKMTWIGVDIDWSPESLARGAVPNVVLYDGERLPFRDASIPLIYSHQVLEHVARPWVVMAEVARVLAPGGVFIGSTSQFEPFHSFSRWGYTPYGFRMLEEMRPAIDGVALITRAYQGRKPEHGSWFVEESPLNVEITEWGEESVRRPALVNNRKLEYCGQFAFKVRRPAPVDPTENG